MSSSRRREEKRMEWELEQMAAEKEQRRKAGLNMWQRIEELDVSADVKDVLHKLATGEREETY